MNLTSKAFELNNKFVIALDGPSGSGKGTVGQLLAKRFELVYFQSSVVYRTLAFDCINKHVNLDDTEKIITLSKIVKYDKKQDLEDEHIASIASIIATIPDVRKNLSEFLVELIYSTPRIIMEGRDIGTHVAPFADLKIFLTSDLMVRARRRYNQLRKKGKDCILEQIFDQLKSRDERDMARSCAPLLPAGDALIIDSSDLTPEEVIEKILKHIYNCSLNR